MDCRCRPQRGSSSDILGSNGAGKTTTLEIVEGIREADSGTVRLLADGDGAGSLVTQA